MTEDQKKYFDNMEVYENLQVSRAKNPTALITAAKSYIDQFGQLQFNGDYSVLTKIRPFPDQSIRSGITYFFTFNLSQL